VFAIGDVRAGSVRRVGAAIGEGAAVVAQIHSFIARQNEATLHAKAHTFQLQHTLKSRYRAGVSEYLERMQHEVRVHACRIGASPNDYGVSNRSGANAARRVGP
jgi:uncharacterized NAD-dependent epimerase/dehydratase family protein